MSPSQNNSEFDHFLSCFEELLINISYSNTLFCSILSFVTLTLGQYLGRKMTQHNTNGLEFMLLVHTTSCMR